jgi:hypothetical protein
MESVAPPPRIFAALIPIVGAATSQRLFFFNLTFSLVSLKHKNTRTLAKEEEKALPRTLPW